MKQSLLIVIVFILGITTSAHGQTKADTSQLVGTWKLDMSPQDKTDNNFAIMRIETVKENSFTGVFYREGVPITEARINTQLGIVYGALVSGDNSGDYNTSFYLKDGVLHGSTHSLKKDFLAVWTATKHSK